MKALIIGAAPVDGSGSLIRSLATVCDMVIAADAAAEWCIAAGVVPDVAVGDFDSASPGALERLKQQRVNVVCFPAEKDASDLDLAIVIAREAGATELVFSACTSGRLDHTLAALGGVIAGADLHPVIREPHLSAWTLSSDVEKRLDLVLPIHTTVSIFALGDALGVTLEGFRYPLVDATLHSLSSHGLSNITMSDKVTVTVASGTLLVIASLDV
ncbi:MAG: thiamine diphosphokinase [Coriobacteriia bacterium]|nr:thiamine diphosphokinase [Coriobacteriia bacterium]